MSEEKMIKSREIYKGQVLHVREDTVLLENGKEVIREIILHPGASGVVAIDSDGKLLMVKQYRYPVGKEVLEIPAGKIDEGETPVQCAARELCEETGIKAKSLAPLAQIHPAAAYTDEGVYLFLASGLSRAEQHLDSDEFLTVHKIDFDRALEMVMDGEIWDSKTQIAILKTARLLGK